MCGGGRKSGRGSPSLPFLISQTAVIVKTDFLWIAVYTAIYLFTLVGKRTAPRVFGIEPKEQQTTSSKETKDKQNDERNHDKRSNRRKGSEVSEMKKEVHCVNDIYTVKFHRVFFFFFF